MQKWAAALIIWLRGLMSSNAVCWYQIDYKEQKRFGGREWELEEEGSKTPQEISSHLNLQLLYFIYCVQQKVFSGVWGCTWWGVVKEDACYKACV